MKLTKFIIKTSKSEIPIDADEIPKLLEAIKRGSPVVFRQGILNPSFFDSLVVDKKENERLLEDYKYEIKEGRIKEFPKHKDEFVEIREVIEKKQLT